MISDPVFAYAIWRVGKHGGYRLRMVVIADCPARHVWVRGGASPRVESWVLGLVDPDAHPAELVAEVLARLKGRHVIRKGEFWGWASAVDAAARLATASVGYGEAGKRAARYRARGQAALVGFHDEVFEPFGGNKIHRTREPRPTPKGQASCPESGPRQPTEDCSPGVRRG